jgi:hypothetical protein
MKNFHDPVGSHNRKNRPFVGSQASAGLNPAIMPSLLCSPTAEILIPTLHQVGHLEAGGKNAT